MWKNIFSSSSSLITIAFYLFIKTHNNGIVVPRDRTYIHNMLLSPNKYLIINLMTNSHWFSNFLFKKKLRNVETLSHIVCSPISLVWKLITWPSSWVLEYEDEVQSTTNSQALITRKNSLSIPLVIMALLRTNF